MASSADLPPAPRLPGQAGAGSGRRPRARALSQEAIVDAALAIIDGEGLDALTMRTVAHALGTRIREMPLTRERIAAALVR